MRFGFKDLYMRIRFFFSLLLLCTLQFSHAQLDIAGRVVDAETQTGLSFVNIGIRNKNIGTRSFADGTFFMQVPLEHQTDTLTFSTVGYTPLKLAIPDIVRGSPISVSLKPKTLDPVVITVSGLTEAKFGIRGDGLVNLGDGSMNQNDIFEIAQVIKLDTSFSRIMSLSLYITESTRDSATFRINFYSFDGNEPGERVIEKSIVVLQKIQEGWLTFDLSSYHIYLKGTIAVAIEFIPTDKKSSPIYYGIKLGGFSKSFVRSASQGAWSIPPHHYRLFVTALVHDKKGKRKTDELEERETMPATVLFSEFVKDSFSIFVSLPETYEKKKEQKFPIIYLLDANVYFDIVASHMVENNMEAILVGVGYRDFLVMDSLRNRDYTFPEAPATDSFPVSGGAANYLSFLTRELIPYMDQNYHVYKNDRTLMGHSLGGYFTLFSLYHALSNNENYFRNFVSASPSLDYCNGYIMQQFQKISDIEDRDQISLFMTFGEREDSEDGETGTQGLDDFNACIKSLEQFKNVRCERKIYPGFGHMQTAIPTFLDGLHKIK